MSDDQAVAEKRAEPWKTEPNFVKWIDPLTGLRCAIMRHPWTGHLNGYVRVPKAMAKKLSAYERMISYPHPLKKNAVVRKYGYAHPSLRKIICHGGLTFSGRMRSANGFWVGFDCNHSGDLAPILVQRMAANSAFAKFANEMMETRTYRDMDYVRTQVGMLAFQVGRLK